MIEIIPAINVDTFDEVMERIKIAEPYVQTIHIDVSDGSFTSHAVWHDASAVSRLVTRAAIEIHYMVDRPENSIEPWLSAPTVKRVIVHEESTRRVGDLIHHAHALGKELGVAIKPQTPWERLEPFLIMADMVQTLAVTPGPSGQQFDERVLEKILKLRQQAPGIPIEVDGGIHSGIAHQCIEAGATRLVVGSSLFTPDMPFAQALEILKRDVGI